MYATDNRLGAQAQPKISGIAILGSLTVVKTGFQGSGSLNAWLDQVSLSLALAFTLIPACVHRGARAHTDTRMHARTYASTSIHISL